MFLYKRWNRSFAFFVPCPCPCRYRCPKKPIGQGHGQGQRQGLGALESIQIQADLRMLSIA